MTEIGSWDFRSEDDLKWSNSYMQDGYLILNGDTDSLSKIRGQIKCSVISYIKKKGRNIETFELSDLHEIVSAEETNDLRLEIMRHYSSSMRINKLYYKAAMEAIHSLCGNELAMQKRIGISINYPKNKDDMLPIHADTWNGVSPYELNVWIPLVDCKKSMCLYILKRKLYEEEINKHKGLLNKPSHIIFETLKNKIEWLEIKYGQILIFDQSLPHGFCINGESKTHLSLNCRFKSLYSPYWDKKLGEYFMPITLRTNSILGNRYREPENWIDE